MITWVVIVALILGIVLGAVVMYFMSRHSAEKGQEMTMQEVVAWLDVRNFIAMAKDQIEGRNTNPPLEGSEWAPVLVPCFGHECARHVTNEECCKDAVEVQGKMYCRCLINLINPTAPVRSVPEDDPKMLTDEEIQMMTTLIERIKDANIKS